MQGTARTGQGWTAALAGLVLGSAVAVLLPVAPPAALWGAAGSAGLLAGAGSRWLGGRWHAPVILLSAALLAASAVGWRTQARGAERLDSSLDGVDLRV